MTPLKNAIAVWSIKLLIKQLINTSWLISQLPVTLINSSDVRQASQIHSEDGINVSISSFLQKLSEGWKQTPCISADASDAL